MNKFFLFLFGCLGTRFLLSFIAYSVPRSFLPALGILALIPFIGFTTIYLFNLRKNGAFSKQIWWDLLRPLHACMYLLFALYSLKKASFSWVFLFTDAVIGFIAWYLHYYCNY